MSIKNKIKKALATTIASFALIGVCGSSCFASIPTKFTETIIISPRETYTGLIIEDTSFTPFPTFGAAPDVEHGVATFVNSGSGEVIYSGPVHFAVGFEQEIVNLAGENPIMFSSLGYCTEGMSSDGYSHLDGTTANAIKFAGKAGNTNFLTNGPIVVILSPDHYERDRNGKVRLIPSEILAAERKARQNIN